MMDTVVNDNRSLSELLGNISLDDIPDNLFVSNLPEELFINEETKHKFEQLFKSFNATSFLYFTKFRRSRVYFLSPQDTAKARITLHLYEFENSILKLSFPEMTVDSGNSPNLEPPQVEKCFLISPPASPPVGWEPIIEHEPVVDLQIISALANLEPGKAHQLFAGTSSTPSVVVHVCESLKANDFGKLKIPQTRRPEFK